MKTSQFKTLITLLLASTQLAVAGVHVDNLWPTNEVTTCFASSNLYTRKFSTRGTINTTNWKAADRANFKKWVQEDFTPVKTGIHFVGFESCDARPDADVILFYAPKTSAFKRFLIGANEMVVPGFALMGAHHDVVRGYPQAKSFVVMADTGMNKRSVVHEFGHVAGLFHEHEHPAAYSIDSKCPAVKKNQPIIPKVTYTDYDTHSSMNYCTFSNLTLHIGLSSRDRALLKKLYPN